MHMQDLPAGLNREKAGRMSQLTWNGEKVRVNFDYPPIPIRSFDWSAWLDGREEFGPYGCGPSRDMAIADLLEQLYERSLEQ